MTAQDQGIQRALGWLQRDMDRTKTWDMLRYDVGTFTPAFLGTSTAGTFTYVSQLGVYTRIEQLVFFRLTVGISAIGVAPVGDMRISGLPLTAASTIQTPVATTVQQLDLGATTVQIMGRVLTSATQIAMLEVIDNAAEVAFPAARFTNAAARVIMAGVYWLD